MADAQRPHESGPLRQGILTGRFDGENCNIGFVTNTDTPYVELIRYATTVNSAIYTLRGITK